MQIDKDVQKILNESKIKNEGQLSTDAIHWTQQSINDYDLWSLYEITDTDFCVLSTRIDDNIVEISRLDNNRTDKWFIWLESNVIKEFPLDTNLQEIISYVNSLYDFEEPLTEEMLQDLIDEERKNGITLELVRRNQ